MEKLFIPYKEAVILKELGFDELCLGSYYTNDKENKNEKYDFREQFQGLEYHPLDKFGASWEPNFIRNTETTYYVSAPLYQQAFDWFRKKYKIDSAIVKHTGFKSKPYTLDIIRNDRESICDCDNDEDLITYNIYEQAQQACLEKLIETIKNK